MQNGNALSHPYSGSLAASPEAAENLPRHRASTERFPTLAESF